MAEDGEGCFSTKCNSPLAKVVRLASAKVSACGLSTRVLCFELI